MNVIGHDAPCDERVALSFEKPKRVCHNLRNALISEPARSVSVPQEPLEGFSLELQKPQAFLCGESAVHSSRTLSQLVSLPLDLSNLFSWNGISQPEANGIDTSFSAPVWK